MKFLTALTFMLFMLNCYASTAKLTHLTLLNNQRVSVAKELKFVQLTQFGKIDLIELKSGNIFYDSEIKNGTLLFQSGNKLEVPVDNLKLDKIQKIRVIGGDGSGGG